MRSDEKLGSRRKESLWSGDMPAAWRSTSDPLRDSSRASGSVSFSGLERNKLFLNLGGKSFEDVSVLSGADSISDSRGVALLDFDRDGWQDLAIVNTNKPLLQLYRNRMGDRGTPGRFIALRLVGGQSDAKPSAEWSNRDGIGALVTLAAGDLTLTRERRAGEGFAAQNSGTLVVGIGQNERAERLRVRWPSGRTQEVEDIAANTLVTLYENPDQAPGDVAAVRAPYRSGHGDFPRPGPHDSQASLLAFEEAGAAPALSLFVTTATWCEACKRSLPQVQALSENFGEEELNLVGVPVDPEDTERMLQRYVAEWRPAYRLLIEASAEAAAQVQALVAREFGEEVLPAAIATDPTGRIIALWDEVPTLSELRRVSMRPGGIPGPAAATLHGAR